MKKNPSKNRRFFYYFRSHERSELPEHIRLSLFINTSIKCYKSIIIFNPLRSHLWKVSQTSHGVWNTRHTPATLSFYQLNNFQYFQLNKIFIYFLNFSFIKRIPKTTNSSRSRSNFQRTNYSYLPSNCWSVRHPCDR